MDYIIIDSPAGIERGFRNALAPADQVLIVTNPEISAVRDADRIIGLIEAEEKGPARLIVNRIKSDMVARQDMLSVEDIWDILRVDVIGVIPEDESILVASNQGTPVALHNNGSRPRSGQAFHNIAQRLEGNTVPMMDLTAREGLFNRLLTWVGGR